MFDSGVTLVAGDTTCTLTSNNIPNHDFNDESARSPPTSPRSSTTFEIPRDPQPADGPSDLSQMSYDGVLLNGVPIDLLSAGCYRPDDPMANAEGIVPIGCSLGDAWLANPLGTEDMFGADEHNAHTQPDGSYHYHGDPHALFDDQPGRARLTGDRLRIRRLPDLRLVLRRPRDRRGPRGGLGLHAEGR